MVGFGKAIPIVSTRILSEAGGGNAAGFAKDSGNDLSATIKLDQPAIVK
jgi:hypothetical protein